MPLPTHDSSEKYTMPHLASIQNLRANLDPVTPMFVLVDPMLGEPLPGGTSESDQQDTQTQREQAWQREVANIVLPKRVPLAQHQHPYLVQLQGIDDSLLALSLDMAHVERTATMQEGLDGDGAAAHKIGGWLQSSMHPEQLAKHMAEVFRVNTEAYTKATYFRLADRRALALLRHVVGDARVTSQLGRLQRWVYLDAHGRTAMLKSISEEVQPIRLSKEEWAAMEQGETLHRTLAQWLGELWRSNIEQPVTQDVFRLYAQVQNTLNEAQKSSKQWPHRFTQPADQTVWAVLHLLYPQLNRSNVVHKLLSQLGTTDDPAETMRYMHTEISSILMAEHAASALR